MPVAMTGLKLVAINTWGAVRVAEGLGLDPIQTGEG